MSQHDFSTLYSKYPEIIEKMPDIFTSHQFILELARQNQIAYIEALYEYRHNTRLDGVTPFMNVHRILAQHLASFPDMVIQTRKTVPSKDIFGGNNACSEWRKVRQDQRE